LRSNTYPTYDYPSIRQISYSQNLDGKLLIFMQSPGKNFCKKYFFQKNSLRDFLKKVFSLFFK
jgi:hypothetical protein